MTDLQAIDASKFDITGMDTYQAARRNVQEKRSELEETKETIRKVRDKLREVRDGDLSSALGARDLEDRLEELRDEAEEQEEALETARDGFEATLEELSAEAGPEFKETWRGLHRDLLQTVRRLHKISEAIAEMDRVRRRVNREVPNRRVDETTVQSRNPLEVHSPPAQDIRDAVSKARVEKLETWMSGRGYAT